MNTRFKPREDFGYLEPLFNAFAEAGKELYFVGGCVRDYLMGNRQPKDIDLATDALPDVVRSLLLNLPQTQGTARVVDKNGGNYGTIHAVYKGVDVEITTYRVDKDYPMGSRRPTVEFSTSIHDDLRRRDFTINALAMTLDGKFVGTRVNGGHLYDFHYLRQGLNTDQVVGWQDLIMNKVLRSPQDPNKLMADDPLRILRAYRFAQRYGFKIDPDLRTAMRRYAINLKYLSRERIQQELVKIAGGPIPHYAFRMMMEDGVLQQIFPKLNNQVGYDQDNWHHHLPLWEHTLKTVEYAASGSSHPDYRLVLAALLHDIAKPTCTQQRWMCPHCDKRLPIGQDSCKEHPFTTMGKAGKSYKGHGAKGAGMALEAMQALKFSVADQEAVFQLIMAHDSYYGVEWNTRNVRRFVNKLGDLWKPMVRLFIADRMAHAPGYDDPDEYVLLEKAIDELVDLSTLVDIKTPINGNVVAIALNMKPGPELGLVMKEMKQLVVDGVMSTPGDAFKWLVDVKGADLVNIGRAVGTQFPLKLELGPEIPLEDLTGVPKLTPEEAATRATGYDPSKIHPPIPTPGRTHG